MAQMPAPICSMASVMMKEGMPITVTPKAVTQPRAAAVSRARMTARKPGSGRLAMLT